jgi:hypothetical protein
MSLFAGRAAIKQAVDYFSSHIYQPDSAHLIGLFDAYCTDLKEPTEMHTLDRFLVQVIDGLALRSIKLDALVLDRVRYDASLHFGLAPV